MLDRFGQGAAFVMIFMAVSWCCSHERNVRTRVASRFCGAWYHAELNFFTKRYTGVHSQRLFHGYTPFRTLISEEFSRSVHP